MIDTSFIDLIKEENLRKIDIDIRLIPTFKKTMVNFQRYFNYMGYTKTRNYQEFFNKYLLTSNKVKKIKIECNNKPSKQNSLGYYCYYDRKIVIDEKNLKSTLELLSTFTHEFIHFLVVENFMEKNNVMYTNSFFEESLTESLKMKILPYSFKSYLPEINLTNYMLLINNDAVNYEDFLNYGLLPNANKDFINILYKYHTEGDDIYYIEAQRYLIKSLNTNIKTFEELDKFIYLIEQRVVDDMEFIDNIYEEVLMNLCKNLGICFEEKEKFIYFFNKYRQIVELLVNKNNFKNVFYFETNNHVYEIDERRKLFKDTNFIKQVNRFIFHGKYETLDVKFKDINFNQIKIKNECIREELLKRKQYIKNELENIQYISNFHKKILKI